MIINSLIITDALGNCFFYFQVAVKDLRGKKEADMSDKRKPKLLKHVEITSGRLYTKNLTHNTILVWRIWGYENLSRNVMYYQLYESESIRCIFRLFKHKEALHVSLSSASIFKDMPAVFRILNEANCESINERAKQIHDGIFVAKFLNEQFLLQDSSFLSNGVLTIMFQYVSDYCTTFTNIRLEIPQFLHHWDDLCYDLKSMYLDALYPDFLLHIKEYTFKCHRIVLAARSKFFCDLLQSYAEIKEHSLSDEVLPGILHQVLLYMYSGELLEMDEDCMMAVYRLASNMEVNALCKRCLEYFKREIDYENCMKFCEFAVEFDLKEMKNMIIHTARKEFPQFNILNIFKEIDKKMAKRR